MKMLLRAKTVCTFTLTELVMAAVIFGLLAAIFFPNTIQAKDSARLNTVYSNLRKPENAKEAWDSEHRKGEGVAVGGVQTFAEYSQGGSAQAVIDE